jgi:tetratricopeptide (TPR) repeat protein
MYYKAVAETLQKQKSPKLGLALQDLIRFYPTTENWKYMLEDFQVRSRMIDRSGLDLFRLMVATGTASSNNEIMEAAQIAFDAGVPWETKAWISSGLSNGKVTKDAGSADLLRRAESAIASEEPIAKQEARAIPEKVGNQDVGVGQVYLSQGNYAKAIDAFKRALTKTPRLKTETTIRLGIAQAMSGDKAAARATLATVTGDPKLVELAQLWALYAEVK